MITLRVRAVAHVPYQTTTVGLTDTPLPEARTDNVEEVSTTNYVPSDSDRPPSSKHLDRADEK
jgi:hypothetical protein